MKELHNHIFSNTTCISKETMLKYINKQLSKKELYEVEKHMLDCELCTDAMEGMKIAINSSILFALDNEIDKRVNLSNKQSYLYKNLMLAASVLVIVFASFFTYKNYIKSIKKEGELAINKTVSKPAEFPKENFIAPNLEQKKVGSAEEISEKKIKDAEKNQPLIVNDENFSTDKFKDNNTDKSNKDEEQSFIQTEETQKSNRNDKLNTEKPTSISESEPIENTVTTKTQEEMVLKDASTNSANSDDVPSAVRQQPAMGNVYQNNGLKNSNKDRYEKEVNSPVYYRSKKTVSAPEKLADNNRIINNQLPESYYEEYKVVDYNTIYQNQEEFKKEAEANSVSPDFSTKKDKEKLNEELDKTIVKISYKSTLQKGIHLYKTKHYSESLVEFNFTKTSR